MYVFVGSTNPVKINCVVNAISETFPDAQVVGVDVPSGIAEQPLSDQETRTGARNRAQAALTLGVQQHPTLGADEILGVGLEGGVFVDDEGVMWSTVWVCVVDNQGSMYESNGARFPVPRIIADKIQSGGEMGPVVEKLVGRADVRQQQGMIGIITNGFVDRTEEYQGIAKMALGLWYGRSWSDKL